VARCALKVALGDSIFQRGAANGEERRTAAGFLLRSIALGGST
jgi:hypothetical protein